MDEKLFVIMEVIESPGPLLGESVRQDNTRLYIPADEKMPRSEYMWLQPERVIPASRLRRGIPKNGEMYFNTVRMGWVKAQGDFNEEKHLILDPPAPVDEWEKWVEEMPNLNMTDRQTTQAWLRRMPRSK